MRALTLCGMAVLQACAVLALAGCQDAAASNPDRDTHMGNVRASAPAPPLPPVAGNAAPTPLGVAVPALVPQATPAAPTPPILTIGDGGVRPGAAPAPQVLPPPRPARPAHP
ncbi:MAG: hypothetical protein FWD17_18360 [Polyangiaceae bacterium]|nr:hypothetical protein [Polyangiaceae bacterium]